MVLFPLSGVLRGFASAKYEKVRNANPCAALLDRRRIREYPKHGASCRPVLLFTMTEGVLTAACVVFIKKMKPDLLGGIYHEKSPSW